MDGLTEGSRIAIGSMPGMDPVAAVQAQLQAFPEVPSWPQLPRKSPKEKMNFQGLSGLPGLSWLTPEQAVWTIPSSDLPEVMEFLKSENEENRLERAAFKPDEAAGFYAFLKEAGLSNLKGVSAVKGQCTGPVTLGHMLQDENGRPLLASKDAMKVLQEYLLLHARWQVRRLGALKKPVVFFIDEPALGAAFEPEAYGLEWDNIQAWLRDLMEPLQAEGVLTGIHCCAPGPWNWVYETPAEFFHFDAFSYMASLEQDPKGLRDFIHKGGMVVWGLVPTSMRKGFFPDPAELFHHWEDALEVLTKKGLSKEELVGRSYFSTSCGLGNSQVSVAEEAIRCLGTLVSLWKANVR